METLKSESHNDSDIIIIDNPPETISLAGSSPESKRQKAKKQHKRKVQVGIDHKSHTETLRITQKIKVKETKFRCILDISNIKSKKCKKAIRSNSIVRFSKNHYKLPNYYERIAPICLRSNCFHLKNDNKRFKLKCCKSKKMKAKLREDPRETIRSLSPISSLSLTEDEHNITYDDVSGGDFPDSSEEELEDELDTLIKRTKEREKQFIKQFSLSSLLYASSPFHTNEDIDSSHSNASTHSKGTLILAPEIYSPLTASPNYIQDTNLIETSQIGSDDVGKGFTNLYNPADPTDTPPRIDFLRDFDQEPTAEFVATKEVNGRPNLPFIKLEKDYSFPTLNVKTEIVQSANSNSVTETNELVVKREGGDFFPNSTKHFQPEYMEEIIKREKNDFPDFIKLENVEFTNCNFATNTEEVFVKREKGSDVNGNFDVNWSC